MVITAYIGAVSLIGGVVLLLTLVPLVYIVVLKDSDKGYRRVLGLVRAMKREHRCGRRRPRWWGRNRELDRSTDESTAREE